MKMKFQLLAMMFIAALAFSACGDDDKNDGITVPDAVSKALKNKYPAATDIEWERKGDYSWPAAGWTVKKWMCGMILRPFGD